MSSGRFILHHSPPSPHSSLTWLPVCYDPQGTKDLPVPAQLMAPPTLPTGPTSWADPWVHGLAWPQPSPIPTALPGHPRLCLPLVPLTRPDPDPPLMGWHPSLASPWPHLHLYFCSCDAFPKILSIFSPFPSLILLNFCSSSGLVSM